MIICNILHLNYILFVYIPTELNSIYELDIFLTLLSYLFNRVLGDEVKKVRRGRSVLGDEVKEVLGNRLPHTS